MIRLALALAYLAFFGGVFYCGILLLQDYLKRKDSQTKKEKEDDKN